ncbi:MAG: glycosyltransferase family 2 protein [Pseudomonadota bacterium]
MTIIAEEQTQRDAPADVSFLICTYNVAPFIEEAIQSALAQTDVTVELIVVDDASSDETPSIVTSLAENDPRIKFHRREKNGGISVSRNQAISMATGTWMAIFDGDDVIPPERSRRMIDIALATGADMVADNYKRVTESGSSTGSMMIPVEAEPYTIDVDIATFIEANVILAGGDFTLGYIKPLVRSTFMREKKIRYRDDGELRNEDYLLFLSCMLAGAKFTVTSESYYKWRMRRGSNSWRLNIKNFDAMIRANEELRLAEVYADDRRIARAARTYDQAMLNGKLLCNVIENAKSGRRLEALMSTATTPAIWPLASRFGLEAIKKRILSTASSN